MMEHISNAINTASLSVKREQSKFTATLDPHVTEVVNQVFVFFYGLCRGFEKQYQDPKRLNLEKTQWILAFMDLGINTLEKAQLGMDKFRLLGPHLNTPMLSEFIKWCTPTAEDIGLPPLKAAYDLSILINRQFSDYKPACLKTYAVIKHAIQQIGASTYRAMVSSEAFKTFEYYYNLACKQFMEGNLAGINKGLEDKTQESSEIKKQDDITLDKFKDVKSRETAFELMRQMLK